jgi:hypothetical protein
MILSLIAQQGSTIERACKLRSRGKVRSLHHTNCPRPGAHLMMKGLLPLWMTTQLSESRSAPAFCNARSALLQVAVSHDAARCAALRTRFASTRHPGGASVDCCGVSRLLLGMQPCASAPVRKPAAVLMCSGHMRLVRLRCSGAVAWHAFQSKTCMRQDCPAVWQAVGQCARLQSSLCTRA